jgi:hypothetical protein
MEIIMARASKKVEQVVEQPIESLQPPAQEQTAVQLTVADLQLLAKIVDLASRRGAFQAAELSNVGEAYNKLAAFLAWVDSEEEKKKQTKE